jgi:uncharacterized protein (DUF983 family)
MDATKAMSADRKPSVFFLRALRLRCPECGESPIFTPLRETRSVSQWMHPLEGCPRCRYKYEREPGYFLLSTWALNYGLVGGLGLLAGLAVEWLWHPPVWQTITCVAVPVLAANVLFVRHSKAIFLAFDHFIDPQRKDPL